MWIAHALTLSRIPIAVVFWLTYGDWRWSLALVVLAALTDAADGKVARWWQRKHGPRHSLGEWLDPLADKVFIILVLGAIQTHDPVPWGLVALIVARELVLIPLATIYRLVAHGRGEHAFQADPIGKAATIAELVALGALVLRTEHLVSLQLIVPLALVAGSLGIIAVIHYIARARHEAHAHH
jgi:cardiolipin synthase